MISRLVLQIPFGEVQERALLENWVDRLYFMSQTAQCKSGLEDRGRWAIVDLRQRALMGKRSIFPAWPFFLWLLTMWQSVSHSINGGHICLKSQIMVRNGVAQATTVLAIPFPRPSSPDVVLDQMKPA